MHIPAKVPASAVPTCFAKWGGYGARGIFPIGAIRIAAGSWNGTSLAVAAACLSLSPAAPALAAGDALTLYSNARPGAVAPDVYRHGGRAQPLPGYAMVRHERELQLARGRNTVRFTDVAALIDPTTVSFESLTDAAGTSVIEQNHMGMPLPAGRIRVNKADPADSTLEFIGEDAIDHTPKNEKVMIRLGSAFDIVGERRQLHFTVDTSRRNMTEEVEVKLRNHKKEPVTVIAKENLYRWTNWQITVKTHDFEKRDARTVHFPLKIAAGGEMVLRYTVHYSW